MNLFHLPRTLFCLIIFILLTDIARSDDGYNLWLKYRKINDPVLLGQYQKVFSAAMITGSSPTIRALRNELNMACRGFFGKDLRTTAAIRGTTLLISTPNNSAWIRKIIPGSDLKKAGGEGYVITTVGLYGKRTVVITAQKEIGLLYGTFHLLRLIETRQPIEVLNIISKPQIQYRLLDHWDNLDGTIERGYGGRSLWHWNDLPGIVDPRYTDYARANASIGINGAVLNNVNANPLILTSDYLKKIAILAGVFRPYGIRVFLSVNFASPIAAKFDFEGNRKGGIGNLTTSDPLDPKVRAWWKNKAREIYRLIPDFGGFLVKANSEGMPGPQDYHRTHAEGADMLADALAPYHGVVMWRAFVYDADVDPDRTKRAYKEFVPLDGKFRRNVFVQGKNGPLDFQPREPVQPLFGAMQRTPMMLELQITQEYLGHSTHLVYLGTMWKEYLDFDLNAKGKGSTLASVIDGTLDHYSMTGIAGVSNIGDDRNWCGHFFAQANWFAFGRLAWDHTLSAETIADDWIRMSLSNDPSVVHDVQTMMMGSREACVEYMEPLGLHHIMGGSHYGPGPQIDRGREDWRSTYYHRADSIGLGYDRSSTGSNAVAQYSEPLRSEFDNITTCPEKYLLWFHHVPWNYKLKSGRTLWEELCFKYYSGTAYVDSMITAWHSLSVKIDPEIFSSVDTKLQTQKTDAALWRDTCLDYFQKFSQQPIMKGQQ